MSSARREFTVHVRSFPRRVQRLRASDEGQSPCGSDFFPRRVFSAMQLRERKRGCTVAAAVGERRQDLNLRPSRPYNRIASPVYVVSGALCPAELRRCNPAQAFLPSGCFCLMSLPRRLTFRFISCTSRNSGSSFVSLSTKPPRS